MEIISKISGMKTHFVINMYEKLNLCKDYIYKFLPLPMKIGHWLF